MSTKEKIEITATALFNRKGINNVTLREVAKTLGISYGNVTYHFKTKNHLISEIYKKMLIETNEILKSFDYQNMFSAILNAPKNSYRISMKYLFFYVDYIEIRRNYKELFAQAEKENAKRKEGFLKILQTLQTQGILRKELKNEDLDYLMDLSGAMRTFFFINLSPTDFGSKELECKYIVYINKLIYPYLTKKGRLEFHSYGGAKG
ncbi:MAG: TetR/AcrR family transcriptional regulator [Bacteroidota bacterium]